MILINMLSEIRMLKINVEIVKDDDDGLLVQSCSLLNISLCRCCAFKFTLKAQTRILHLDLFSFI